MEKSILVNAEEIDKRLQMLFKIVTNEYLTNTFLELYGTYFDNSESKFVFLSMIMSFKKDSVIYTEYIFDNINDMFQYLLDRDKNNVIAIPQASELVESSKKNLDYCKNMVTLIKSE